MFIYEDLIACTVPSMKCLVYFLGCKSSEIIYLSLGLSSVLQIIYIFV